MICPQAISRNGASRWFISHTVEVQKIGSCQIQARAKLDDSSPAWLASDEKSQTSQAHLLSRTKHIPVSEPGGSWNENLSSRI